MPDLTPFEARLTDLLVADSVAGIRPVDRYAIARSVIGGGIAGGRLGRLGRATGRPMLIAATVALLVLALAAGALLVAGRLHLEVLPVRHSYTGELISAPDLPTPMERPVVVALLDGRVLIIGADNADPTSVAYPYDPATGISVPVPVVHGAIDAAVRLDDGRVLAIGDEGAQLFDPASGRFSAVGPMLADRTGASMTVLRDSRVLIAGGMPARGESGVDSALRSAELFDPATMAFSPTGSIATPTGGGPMVTLSDGRVFMATDPTAEVYDPATGTFSAATTMSGGGGRPVVLSDGRVVLFGSTGLYSGGSITVWDPTHGQIHDR